MVRDGGANDNIERSYYQTAINQRIKRTIRVAQACFAATLAGTAFAGVTKEAPAIAVAAPAALIAVAERRRSINALDNLVGNYTVSSNSMNSSIVSEQAVIHGGELHSFRYLDSRTELQDLGWIGLQQSGAFLGGLIGGAVAASSPHDPATAPALLLAGIGGAVGAGGLFVDSHTLRESYNARLENVDGIAAIGVV